MPARSPTVPLAVALVVALAGCLASVEDPAPPVAPAAAPAGCDASRPGVAHAPGGVALAAAPFPLVPCLHPTGTPAIEPTIGVASDGTVLYYPVWTPGLMGGGIGVSRSRDGGATWEVLRPEVAGVPTHAASQDPYVYLDPATDRLFAEDLFVPPFNCGSLSMSDDAGDSWTETLSGCAQFDHVTLFAGPPRASPTQGYPNVVYRCAISGGALSGASTMVTCQRSIDGGRAWLPPGAPAFAFLPGAARPEVPGACDGGSGHGVTDAEGRVYLPRLHCGEPWLAVSDDEALTWRTVRVNDALGGACSVAVCEHDAGVGVDAAGTVYYAWVAADRLPYLSTSRDGGETWSEPMMIGAPGVDEAALLQIAVGGAGRLAFVYYGTTESPGAPFEGGYAGTPWNAYLGASLDADAPSPTFVTAALNDPADPMVRGACGPLRCSNVYDFIDIRIAPDGAPWVPLVDACTGACSSDPQGSAEASDGVAARAWGAPSLWDAADANGPYP